MPLRLAMWSGPRNVSTALMRSFEARGDTFVSDEPFYAHYLARTGVPHPAREEILARHETDAARVAAWLTGPVPGGKAVFYQKHMAHHLLPEVDGPWLDEVEHAFLIREPREMLTSLVRITPRPRLEDTGLPQQWALFERVRAARGRVPLVIDGRDLLEAPGAVLLAACARLGLDYTERMLSWPPGRRPTDGVWAEHWYAAVEASTGFAPYRPKPRAVPDALADVLAACERYHARLRPFRVVA